MRLIPKISNQEVQIWLYAQIGWLYYSYNFYEKALEYFLQSSQQIESMTAPVLIQADEIYMHHSFFYFTIKDYNKSIYYAKKALEHTDEKTKNYSSILNSLGNTFYELQKPEKATYYFKKALKFSKNNNDSLRYAKILGDYAKLYIDKKDFQNAEALLLKDIQISQQLKADRNVMFAQLRLAEMYLLDNQIAKAKILLDQAQDYAKTKNYLQLFNLKLSLLLMEIAYNEGDQSNELKLRRYTDSLRLVIDQKEGNYVLDKINWKSQKEAVLRQLNAEHEILRKNRWIQWGFIILSVLLLIILYLWIKNFKERLKRAKIEFDHALMKYKIANTNSEKQLEQSNRSLASYQIYLKEKQEQIEQLEVELQQLKKNQHTYTNKQKLSYEELLNSHLMTQDKWLQFKKAFIEEQADFYQALCEKFPGLTDSNLRIIFLQKLGLNNTEISRLNGVTLFAVKKSKQRIAKKYEVTFDEILSLK